MSAHDEEQEPPEGRDNQLPPNTTGARSSQENSASDGEGATEPDLEAKVEKLLAKHEELLQRAEKPKPKDRWDKIGLSGPLAVAAVGVLLTSVYQCNVTRQAKITQEATQRAQNLQSFGAFMEYLTSADSAQQQLAISALRRLGNCEVAALAAGLNPSGGTREGLLELKRIAEINPGKGCDFADTVYQRIFLDPDNLVKPPPEGPPPEGLGPVETISAGTIPLNRASPAPVRGSTPLQKR
jgi:hypothetical protein